MTVENTPFESRELVATKNGLSFFDGRYVISTNTNAKYSGSGMHWGFSLLFKADENTGTKDLLSWFQTTFPDSVGNGIILRTQADSGEGFRLKFSVATSLGADTIHCTTPYLFINRWYRLSIWIEAWDGSNTHICCKLNDGTIIRTAFPFQYTVTLSDNLVIGSDFYSGYDLSFEGQICNLVFWKSIPTEGELSFLHNTNVIPESLHEFATAHYTFNQTHGKKLFDNVEQYNYAKAISLSANHGDLVNYTDDESGLTNPFLQTVWRNIYSNGERTGFYGRLNGAGQYLTIPSYTNVTIPSWTFFFSFIAPTVTGTPQAFFGNDLGSPTVYFRFNTTSNEIEIFLNGLSNRLATSLYVPGKEIKFIIWTDGVKSRLYINQTTYTIPESNFTDSAFDDFIFGYNHFFGSTLKAGVGRVVLVDHACDEYERQLLFNANEVDGYKQLNRVLDLDFGDMFIDSGNYYVRDSSGNNRHAMFNLFTPSTDQPLIQGALRLVSGSGHRIQSFGVPTKMIPTGTTLIIGFMLDSDRNFSGNELIYSTSTSFVYGLNGTRQLQRVSPQGLSNQLGAVDKTNHPIFIIYRDKNNPNNTDFLLNGFNKTINARSATVDSETNDYFIGGGVLANLNGYIFHFSLWGDSMSDVEILNIVNNNDSDASKSIVYLDFSQIINDGGIYRITDKSPNNGDYRLINYTVNEITPGDPAYKLFDLDTLR